MYMKWFILVMVGGLFGCSTSVLLPSEKNVIESPWETFDEAKNSYDLIIPNYTKVEELAELGFDPFSTPNLVRLNYLDVISKFIPNQAVDVQDLDPNVRKCIQARDSCYAYHATPNNNSKKRVGNLFLDVMNFRKQTRLAGWTFDAFIVILDDTVVYKIWGGQPTMVESKDKKNPLGPIQGIRDILRN